MLRVRESVDLSEKRLNKLNFMQKFLALATVIAWKTKEQRKYSKLSRNLLKEFVEFLKLNNTKNLIQNWLEDLNNHVLREDKQVVNKQDKWLNMIKHAGMQIRTSMKCHLTQDKHKRKEQTSRM